MLLLFFWRRVEAPIAVDVDRRVPETYAATAARVGDTIAPGATGRVSDATTITGGRSF